MSGPAGAGLLVARIAPRPVFFIYATHGQGGEVELNPVFYAAARQPEAIWAMEDASRSRKELHILFPGSILAGRRLLSSASVARPA